MGIGPRLKLAIDAALVIVVGGGDDVDAAAMANSQRQKWF